MSDDLFDAVEALEQDHSILGETHGTRAGKERQYTDGYVKGWQQAAHVLHEIGSLYAILSAFSLNCQCETEPVQDEMSTQATAATSVVTTENPSLDGKEISNGRCAVHKVLTTRQQASLNRVLDDLSNHRMWLALGRNSEEELAEHLSSVQTQAKFLLHKLKIPTRFEDKTVDADF
ncbi:uncharacterized protein LOC125178307 [Hyalella azteca]|uniref:Uncharacterized protein LOC125178307 n=1 Tax=Hyalella azteca TaxID=294128 RepID=A0A979FL24_HYAAZ|nr:uncharacterized protein LOC125178307 [Hyalella azteca]